MESEFEQVFKYLFTVLHKETALRSELSHLSNQCCHPALSRDDREQAAEDEQAILDILRKSFYVDDSVSLLKSNAVAHSFKVRCQSMAKAGMKLHKCKHSHEVDDGKVLGVHWCSAADEFLVS